MKRPNSDENEENGGENQLVVAKKQKHELATIQDGAGELVEATSKPRRTSNMEAPIMLLTGHAGDIYAARFHPEGKILASAGFDRQIFFWNVYGECDNFHAISGCHSGAILDLKFSNDNHVFTASTDKTVGVFDVATGTRIKRLKGHSTYVNAVDPSRKSPLVASASDDCTVKVWDRRSRGAVLNMNSTYQVTAVAFDEDAERVISAGIDNHVKIWDTRKPTAAALALPGHTDTVSGMALSPDGSYVLTNGMDNTLRVWDIRPFAPEERCVKILTGHQHNFEKNLLHCAWSPDGGLVSAGSADRFVYVWDTTSRRILYKLPGHLGSVNAVDFHIDEPIVLSAGSDKQILLGELDL